MRLYRHAVAILFAGALGAEVHPQDAARGGLAAWDTLQASKDPLTPAALGEKRGWSAIAPGSTATSFKGDVVLSNGRIAAVVRKQAAAVELYGTGTQRSRLVLQGPGGEPAARLASAALVDHGKGAAVLEVSFKTSQGRDAAAKLRLKRGEVFVEIEPGAGAARVRVEAPCRFAVLPDFFADDIVVDATKVPTPAAELPSENFVLHLANQGGAIVMAVFENREQDVRATLSGEGESRTFTGSEIEVGKDRKKVWVALIEGPQVWHSAAVRVGEAAKVVPLEWKMPFPALWRVDFTRTDDLTQSWEMLLQEKEGGDYLKPAWGGTGSERVPTTRKRWMGSMMYTVQYPCWSDAQGKGYLQPIKANWASYQGPVVLYPANRVAQTPPDAFTVVDLVRNTMGQGPCEYILDLEGQKSERKGRATCSVREELKMIYEAREQKQRRKEIEQFLQQGIDFVKNTRARIEQYLAFAGQMRRYLAEQKKSHPEVAEAVAPLEKILRQADSFLEDRKEKIKTPEHVVQMTEEFRKTMLAYDGPDVLEKLKAYTDALTEVGGNQDDLVARLRWVVKQLRERAGLLMTQNLKLAPIAQEIRTRSREALRKPLVHEEGTRQ